MNTKEIESLCKDVCDNLQDGLNAEESKSLRQLRIMCGLRECGCSLFTPSQNLRRILKVISSESALSLSVGLAIISNCDILEQEKHCNEVLERIAKLAISMEPSEERNHFLAQLWNYSGLKHFTISTIEDVISHHCYFLEKDVLEVFTQSVQLNSHRPLRDLRYERILQWSCNSSRIFCAVTSIFNEVLQESVKLYGQYKAAISVISQFIDDVRLTCIGNKKDFVLLYPIEYQSLVAVLDITPDCYPDCCSVKSSVTIATVVEIIERNISKKPVQTLCILTHFPAWLPYVKS
ncbi:uncharacterized protein LOC128995249 [Macrosteles quadrilineatus]|uniref:uncharacterized protein LOC128995249 n=1 Tax=Macrosteles quadrilineatus TaxID=74068 RepID=UPI0023E29F34|nr:uncharacterized protein LOC128995249 [Macrosteles quadrilineatus]XP_054276175.1 uncharacterized protein LOC128995249 [Macrosteles quadrilineatus]